MLSAERVAPINTLMPGDWHNCFFILPLVTGGTVDAFKHRLDTYLQNVPDQPLIPGYTAYRSVDSNSLLSWAAHQAWHRPEDTVVPMFQQSLRMDQPGSP